MKKLTTLLFGMCALAAVSCSSDDENNAVKENNCFEKTRVEIGCKSDTLRIPAVKKGWKLDNVTVDGVNFNLNKETERNEYNFSWLTVKCSNDDITLITTNNYGDKRDFVLNIKDSDNVSQEITGSQESELEEGDIIAGNATDIIHMTPRDGVFPASGGTITINTAENIHWGFSEIFLYNNYENRINYKEDLLYYPGPHLEDLEYARSDNFDVTCEWLNLKRDYSKLYVTVAPNTTETARYIRFSLWTGDYFCWFFGCQAAE